MIISNSGLIAGNGTLTPDGFGPFDVAAPAGPPLDVLPLAAVAGTNTGIAASGPFTILANYGTTIANLGTASALYNNLTQSINAAIGYFEANILNNITVTIQFDYGKVNTFGLGSALGESETIFNIYNYGQIYNALSASARANNLPGVANTLPATDPTGNSNAQWTISQAEAKAVGLNSGVSLDGYAGISDANTLTFDPNARAVSGAYDAIGIWEHEISEVLGRVQSLGGGNNAYVPFDLFRYLNGARQLSPGPGYFSADGGVTNLGAFNNTTPPNSGDSADWASSVPNDAFDASANIGVANTVSAVDRRVLNVLGFTTSAPCYAAGTHIRGAGGKEIKVEDLRPGDWVETRFMGHARVQWIGGRRIDCVLHPDPRMVWPVRVAADAFGPGLPRRDLMLSPDHAVAAGGGLIPIRLLINGFSIRQQTETRIVHYFHIELARHDIVLAEGLPAESYLDTGNRGLFANGGAAPDPRALGAAGRREAESCLPLLTEPADVLPVWTALSGGGHQMPAVTDDPDLHLVLDGRRQDAAAVRDGRFWFAIPKGPRAARLDSHRAAPSDTRPWLEDRRRLGVMVRGLSIHRAGSVTEIALDDPALGAGWWAAEADDASMWRWTAGAAALPLLSGPAVLEVALAGAHIYPAVAPAG